MEDFLFLDNLLNDDEKIIRENVRRFVDAEVIPLMPDAYEKGEFPQPFISKVGQLGLLGMTLPQEYGGSGASYVGYGIACQELERGDSGLRSFVSVQSSLCMFPIYAYGSEAQKQRFLPKMARGEIVGCFGLTEPEAGSDPVSMTTFARKVPGGWNLNGNKFWITNATLADVAIVWAKTDEGIRGFILEKEMHGLQRREITHKMSLRASSTGELVMENCFVPDENYLPGSTRGLVCPLSCLTQARYGIGWGTIGAAIACYEIVVEYCKQRKQFGRPIGSFQLVQKDLVMMLTEIVKAQLLNLQVGRLKDQNQATFAHISLIKMNNSRQALQIARTARNLLGANGISLEYHVIRHMNNLESVFTYEGTDNVHTLILGKHITGLDAFQ